MKTDPKPKPNYLGSGLSQLTPMYGPTIAAAPVWSGPFIPPEIPKVEMPQPQDDSDPYRQFGGIAANLLTTGACIGATGGMGALIGCPLLGDIAKSLVLNF